MKFETSLFRFLPQLVATSICLQQQHVDESPSQTLQRLALTCQQHLGVDTWDVYGDFDKAYGGSLSTTAASSYLRQFEQEISRALGKEDAVFMPSGVMAQSIALLIHQQNEAKRKGNLQTVKDKFDEEERRSAFACHHTSHLLLHEQNSHQELLRMQCRVLSTLDEANGISVPPLSFAQVEDKLLSDSKLSVHTLILELPHREIGGKMTSYDDILKMSRFCRDNGVAFHCDGARLFEAAGGYLSSGELEGMENYETLLPLQELANPFDSVYISFYKGLGGMSGAMLLGTTEFCDQARIWLRRFGGNLYTLLPYAVSGWAGYRRNVLLINDVPNDEEVDPETEEADSKKLFSFVQKHEKLVEVVLSLSVHPDIGKVVAFDPTIPETNMVHGYLKDELALCQKALDKVFEASGIRVLKRLRSVSPENPAFEEGYQSMFEWAMGEFNGNIPNDVYVSAWSDFARILSELKGKEDR